MKTREETFALREGAGRIEVRGDRYGCGLFVDGGAVSLNWCDCAGSIGQVFCRFEDHNFEESVAAFRALVEQGPDPSKSLLGQFFPLLRQFPTGDYRLTVAQLTREDRVCEWGEPYRLSDLSDYHPHRGTHLIPSQSEASLDLERVFEFIARIESGERPLLITATADEAFCEFVLDGHHKLLAYTEVRVKPWRLCICAKSPSLTGAEWPNGAGAAPLSWKQCFGLPSPEPEWLRGLG